MDRNLIAKRAIGERAMNMRATAIAVMLLAWIQGAVAAALDAGSRVHLPSIKSRARHAPGFDPKFAAAAGAYSNTRLGKARSAPVATTGLGEVSLLLVVTNRTASPEARIKGIRSLAEMHATSAIPRLIECTDLYDPATRTYPALEALVTMGTSCVARIHAFVLHASPTNQEVQIMHAGCILRALEGDRKADQWAEENRARVPVATYQMLMYKESP